MFLGSIAPTWIVIAKVLISVQSSNVNESRTLYSEKLTFNLKPILNITSRIRQRSTTISTTEPTTVSVRINSKRLVPQNFDTSKCLIKFNSLLCSETDNYPWKEVQNILSSKKLSVDLFGNDTLSTSDPKSNKADEAHEQQFCKSVETIQFPKIAQNRNSDLRYIIQGDTSIFRRGIRTESCLPNAECMFASHLPPGISVQCVQKYMLKKLVALEPLTGDAYFDDFPVPSCCVCMFRNKDNEYDDDK